MTLLTGEIPHRAPEHVAPPALQHIAVRTRPIERLLEGEPVGRLSVREVHDVHAPGVDLACGSVVGPRAIMSSAYESMKDQ